MTAVRFPEKFETIGGTVSYSFSKNGMEAQFEQGLRTPVSIGVGADYAHDHLGYGVAPRDPGIISIRCLAVESSPTNLATEIDEAGSELYLGALGYLYRLEADESTRRRCLARLTAMPSVTINFTWQFGVTPQIFQFRKLSDWQATSLTEGADTITADPTLVSITNSGNLPVKSGLILTLEALTASGFSNPEIWNQTTGQRISTTRDAITIGSQWRIGDPDFAVTFSAYPSLVAGKSGRLVGRSVIGNRDYANDYALTTVTNGFLTLAPGVNQLLVSGVTNATLSHSFYGSYT